MVPQDPQERTTEASQIRPSFALDALTRFPDFPSAGGMDDVTFTLAVAAFQHHDMTLVHQKVPRQCLHRIRRQGTETEVFLQP